jgi:hypothetical protein
MSTPVKEINVAKLRRKGFTTTTFLLQEEEILIMLTGNKPKFIKKSKATNATYKKYV